MLKRTTFYEYSGFISEGSLSTDLYPAFSRQEAAYLRNLSRQMGGEGSVFTFGFDSIRAGSYVGVIRYGAREIEILPKLLAGTQSPNRSELLSNLSTMLAHAGYLEHSFFDSAAIASRDGTLLEILIGQYASKLLRLAKTFFVRSYVRKTENLRFIRGKIDFKADVHFNPHDKSRIYCSYGEFSEDNLVNQTFKHVSQVVLRHSNDPYNRKNLKLCIKYLSEVSNRAVELSEVASIEVPRAYREYQPVFRLAKMFLANQSMDFSGRGRQQPAVLFEMNELFERFIAGFVDRHSQELGVSQAVTQVSKNLVSSVSDFVSGTEVFGQSSNTFVDLALRLTDGTKVIVDTKYKLLDRNESGRLNLSNSDVYQIAAYQKLHKLDTTSKIILLYPQNEERLRLRFTLNGDLPQLYVCTVDLHRPFANDPSELFSELREIFQAS